MKPFKLFLITFLLMGFMTSCEREETPGSDTPANNSDISGISKIPKIPKIPKTPDTDINVGPSPSNNDGTLPTTLAKLRAAAEQGDGVAQFKLGVMYYLGQGITQDYKQAFKWFNKSADQGNDDAQYNLGIMYHKGQGVSQDYKQAFKWFKKSAEQGHAEAQHNLGVMYYNGQGITQDYEQALTWLNKSAEQGYAEAQKLLDKLYKIDTALEHRRELQMQHLRIKISNTQPA